MLFSVLVAISVLVLEAGSQPIDGGKVKRDSGKDIKPVYGEQKPYPDTWPEDLVKRGLWGDKHKKSSSVTSSDCETSSTPAPVNKHSKTSESSSLDCSTTDSESSLVTSTPSSECSDSTVYIDTTIATTVETTVAPDVGKRFLLDKLKDMKSKKHGKKPQPKETPQPKKPHPKKPQPKETPQPEKPQPKETPQPKKPHPKKPLSKMPLSKKPISKMPLSKMPHPKKTKEGKSEDESSEDCK